VVLPTAQCGPPPAQCCYSRSAQWWLFPFRTLVGYSCPALLGYSCPSLLGIPPCPLLGYSLSAHPVVYSLSAHPVVIPVFVVNRRCTYCSWSVILPTPGRLSVITVNIPDSWDVRTVLGTLITECQELFTPTSIQEGRGGLSHPGITTSLPGNAAIRQGNPLQKAVLHKDPLLLKSSLSLIETVNHHISHLSALSSQPLGYSPREQHLSDGNNSEYQEITVLRGIKTPYKQALNRLKPPNPSFSVKRRLRTLGPPFCPKPLRPSGPQGIAP